MFEWSQYFQNKPFLSYTNIYGNLALIAVENIYRVYKLETHNYTTIETYNGDYLKCNESVFTIQYRLRGANNGE